MTPKTILITLLFLTVLTGCHKDSDDPVDTSIIAEFVNLRTGEYGEWRNIVTDRGQEIPVHPSTTATLNLAPDTTYRVVCEYVMEDNMALIHNTTPTSTLIPESVMEGQIFHELLGAHRDKFLIRSAWIGGGYLNIIMEINANNGKHPLAVLITETAPLTFCIHHDGSHDTYGYNRMAYITIPLAEYNISKGEAIFINCHFNDEILTLRVVY